MTDGDGGEEEAECPESNGNDVQNRGDIERSACGEEETAIEKDEGELDEAIAERIQEVERIGSLSLAVIVNGRFITTCERKERNTYLSLDG